MRKSTKLLVTLLISTLSLKCYSQNTTPFEKQINKALNEGLLWRSQLNNARDLINKQSETIRLQETLVLKLKAENSVAYRIIDEKNKININLENLLSLSQKRVKRRGKVIVVLVAATLVNGSMLYVLTR